MNEDVVVPIAFFGTVIVLSLGIPLMLAWKRRWERADRAIGLTPELSHRLDRLEAMVETVQIEVERMAEGQRFTSRLLSEGAMHPLRAREPARANDHVQVSSDEVTHA